MNSENNDINNNSNQKQEYNNYSSNSINNSFLDITNGLNEIYKEYIGIQNYDSHDWELHNTELISLHKKNTKSIENFKNIILSIKDKFSDSQKEEIFKRLKLIIELAKATDIKIKEEIPEKFSTKDDSNFSEYNKNLIESKTIKDNTNHSTTKKVSPVPVLNIFKFILLVVLIGLICYLFLKLYQSYTYKATYIADFDKNFYKNQKEFFIINEPKDTNKIKLSGEINDKTLAELSGSPISFLFRPEEYLLNKTISLGAEFKGEGDWEISLLCEKCSSESKYNWKPFYYGNLSSYNLIKTFDEINIYSQKTFNNDKTYSNIEDWLGNNLGKQNSVNILNKDYPKSKIINTEVKNQYVPNSYTEINTSLRGPHKFYVYLENKLDLNVLKYDLNKYKGQDKVKIKLFDLDDNLIKEFVIEDDGNEEADDQKYTSPIEKKFEYDLSNNGIYLLSIENFEGEKSDWNIEYLKINTNKIIFTGSVIIQKPYNLYTEISAQKNLKVLFKDNTDGIRVAITSSNFTQEINYDPKKIYSDILVNLLPDKYQINLSGTQILSGSNFSINPEGYFEPFLYDLTKLDEPDVIIGKYSYHTNNDWINVAQQFSSNEVKNAINENKEIQFVLRNKPLEQQYKKENDLISRGINFISQNNDFKLYGVSNPINFISKKENISDWLTDVLASGASLNLDETINLPTSIFASKDKPDGFSEEINNIDFNLRGSHDFYVYLENNLITDFDIQELNKYAGKDVVKVSLLNTDDKEMCSKILEDDGNETDNQNLSEKISSLNCENITNGVYILRFEEILQENIGKKSDFIIKNFSINSNKIVARNKLLNTDKINIYTKNDDIEFLDFYHWQKGYEQKIQVINNNSTDINLSEKELDKHTEYRLQKGNNTIKIPKGYILISGSNFAFKPENWFVPYKLIIKNDNSGTYYLLNNNYKNSDFVKELSLQVK